MESKNASEHSTGGMIYKIVSAQQWEEAEAAQVFSGAAIDLTDGYIHFSTASQVKETAEKHFSGQMGLLLVTVDSDALGKDLRWEQSRGGALFPHLYGTLSFENVESVVDLPIGKNGNHLYPDELE